jgi:hypothetical protein
VARLFIKHKVGPILSEIESMIPADTHNKYSICMNTLHNRKQATILSECGSMVPADTHSKYSKCINTLHKEKQAKIW